MSVVSGFTLKGATAMDEQLGHLPDDLRREFIVAGVAAGGRVVAKEMRRLAPKGGGNLYSGHSKATMAKRHENAAKRKRLDKQTGSTKLLADSIRQRPSKQWRSASATARAGIVATAVGPTWPEGAHAHNLEHGHQLVAWGRRTGLRTRRFPFIRPAIDNSRSDVLRAQERAVRRGLKKLAKDMQALVDRAAAQPMDDICYGVRAHLLSRPDVLAALTSRGPKIYPDVLPQKDGRITTDLPAATIEVVSGDSDSDLEGGNGVARSRVSLTAYGASRSAANALAEAMRRALHGYSGSAGDERILSCELTSRRHVSDPPTDGSPDWRYLTVYDYDTLHTEPVTGAARL